MGKIGELFAEAGLKIDQSSFSQYASELNNMEGKIGEFNSVSSAISASALAAPAIGIGALAAEGLELAASYQDAGVSLKNLYGDAEVAKEKFAWMTEFAAETPFGFEEIEEGAIKLKAYGMDIQEYGKTFGDTAAGMGKSLDQVIEAVADAQTGEFERMKELGIKAVQVTKSNVAEFEKFGGSVGDTMLTYTNRAGEQMAQAVDRNNRKMVTSTIAAIWNEKYENAMETRSKTFNGMMSTFSDNISFALTKLAGYDMKNMEVRSFSLLGAMNLLVDVGIKLTVGISNLSTPMATFVGVAALGVAAISLLAAGFVAYSAILPLVSGSTAIFGTTLSAAIWPATLAVLGIAALAAGLSYLDEKTDIISTSWQLLTDIFIIASSEISRVVDLLANWITRRIAEIQQAISNMIPQGAISTITGAIDFIGSKFGGFASDVHTKAAGIQGDNKQTSESFDTMKNKDFSPLSAGLQGAANAVAGVGSAASGSETKVKSLTDSLLDSVKATKDLWAAQNQIASFNMTVAKASMTERGTYGSGATSLGSVSKEGVRVIPRSDPTNYNKELSVYQKAGVNINVGTVNNYGESNSQNKNKLRIIARG